MIIGFADIFRHLFIIAHQWVQKRLERHIRVKFWSQNGGIWSPLVGVIQAPTRKIFSTVRKISTFLSSNFRNFSGNIGQFIFTIGTNKLEQVVFQRKEILAMLQHEKQGYLTIEKYSKKSPVQKHSNFLSFAHYLHWFFTCNRIIWAGIPFNSVYP